MVTELYVENRFRWNLKILFPCLQPVRVGKEFSEEFTCGWKPRTVHSIFSNLPRILKIKIKSTTLRLMLII
jgi:hypothetical protein